MEIPEDSLELCVGLPCLFVRAEKGGVEGSLWYVDRLGEVSSVSRKLAMTTRRYRDGRATLRAVVMSQHSTHSREECFAVPVWSSLRVQYFGRCFERVFVLASTCRGTRSRS